MSTVRTDRVEDREGNPLWDVNGGILGNVTTSTGTDQPLPDALEDRVSTSNKTESDAQFLYNTDYYGIGPYRIPGQDHIDLINGGGTEHRHFGGIARTNDSVIHLSYRLGARHGTDGEGAIIYRQVYEEGASVGTEVVISPSEIGKDKRDCTIFATPRGRLTVQYTVLDSDGTGPVFFYSTHSDDNGVTWSTPVEYDTTVESFSRTYGPVAIIPDNTSLGYRLVKPSYKQVGAAEYVNTLYYSEDDGATWVEGVPIKDETDPSAENETAVLFLNKEIGIAVARGSGLNYSYTSDGGLSWSAFVQPSWATGSEKVSPSLNTIVVGGKQYAFLAWTNRSTDSLSFAWASIDELDTTGEGFAGTPEAALTGLLVNASGYQSFISYDQGQLLGVVYKEYLSPDESSDVYLVTIPAKQWIEEALREQRGTWTPTIYGGTTAGSPVASVATGTYTKHDSLVTCTLRIVLTSKGGATGQVFIGELPFTNISGVENRAAMNLPFINNYDLTGYLAMTGQVFENSKTGRLWRQGTTGTDTLPFTQINDNFNLYATFSYFTDE